MLNGLSWHPKSRRKRGSYRYQAARLVTLNLLNGATPTLETPTLGRSLFKKLRQRIRGKYISSKWRAPLDRYLASAALHSLTRTPSTCYLDRSRCRALTRRITPLRQSPTLVYSSSMAAPTRTTLRLFYLFLLSPTSAALNPSRSVRRWSVAKSGCLLKAPFATL